MADRTITRVIKEPITDNVAANTEIEYVVTRSVHTDGTIQRRVQVRYQHPGEPAYFRAWDNDAIPTGAGSVGTTARNAVAAALAAAKTEWGF